LGQKFNKFNERKVFHTILSDKALIHSNQENPRAIIPIKDQNRNTIPITTSQNWK